MHTGEPYDPSGRVSSSTLGAVSNSTGLGLPAHSAFLLSKIRHTVVMEIPKSHS